MTAFNRLAAYRELYRRYRNTFSYFWKRRKNLNEGIFNEHEAAFLPAALSLQEKPVSTTARLTAHILITMIFAALIWSVFGKLDIIVNASGKIIPSSYTKTIASVEVASVNALYVQDGQIVRAGDILIELDSSATDAEHDKALGDAALATLQTARSRALIEAIETLKSPILPQIAGVSDDQWSAEQEHLVGQYQDFRAKLKRLDDEIFRYSLELPLAKQRANDYKLLAESHDVSNHSWLEKEQMRIDIEGQLDDAKNQRKALITQTKKDAYDALTDGHRITSASEQDARRAGEHSNLLKLKAPVDGTVQQLNVHAIGSIVQAAQPIMLIVPSEHQVLVEAELENKDIGFVQEEQDAEVKVDAFDYTKYGTVRAKITNVSRDAVADEKRGLVYAIKLALEQSSIQIEDKAVPLSPGLSVNVQIKTGDRRIIEYILSPIIQHKHDALNER